MNTTFAIIRRALLAALAALAITMVGCNSGAAPSPAPSASMSPFSLYPLPLTNGPGEIVAGPDGNIWFTEQYFAVTSKVAKITNLGVVTEYQTPTANGGPAGITVGPDGNLWFTESIAGKVCKITTNGSITVS